MKSLMKVAALTLCTTIVPTSMGGCHKCRMTNCPTDVVVPEQTANGQPELSPPIGCPMRWNELNAQSTVYFDYDKAEIRADQFPKLEFAACEIKKLGPNVQVRVEGNCDERGTQEYNVALGERRALAVRDYLIKLGCDGSRLVTISYGEEMPADPGHEEGAWSKNRRAEFSKNG